MKVPLSWLKQYVDIDIPVEELAERLTLAGLEVESVEYVGLPEAQLPWDPEKIVVGEVRAVYAHPDADRLVLAEVAHGEPDTEVVVTGAPSLLGRVGERDLHLKVAFAREGARLYNGHAEGKEVITLRAAKIRGIPSRAMVASEKELGLSQEQSDIIYLPDDAPAGMPLVEYMGDAVLEFDIKGPFAHLNSVIGVAREAAALLGVSVRRDVLEVMAHHPAQLSPDPDYVNLEIADSALCPRYSVAFVKGVEVGPSPFWMQMRLRHAGLRPINNIVDVTNYVMLELGQPLHAFDYDVLRPRAGEERPAIVVRRAKPGERMRTLDGQLHTFDERMLLITDGGGAVAVAGVMGGEESEVSDATRRVLLESANFRYLNVRRTARELGLPTESSQRFGRQIDPELTVKAAARAAHLMADLGDASVSPVIGDLFPGRAARRVLDIEPEYVDRILGIEIPLEDIVRILTSLEFDVTPSANQAEILRVTVPSHRQDVTRPADLVEEVARIWGYDRFPATRMRDELPPQRENLRLMGAEIARDLLVGCGLDEVITYSLASAEDEAKLRPGAPARDPDEYLRLRNPLSSTQDTLRQTLLPSLVHTTRANLRFLSRVAIFEIGRIYLPVTGSALPEEERHLGIVMTGPREDRSWLAHQDRTMVDFFDMKGVVETLLERLGVEAIYEPGDGEPFHPGRCARVRANGEQVGTMGELHPRLRAAFGLPEQPICASEFDLDVILAHKDVWEEMKPLSSHPPVYEDLAVVVDEDVPAADVRDVIARAGMPLVRSIELFDTYRGAPVGSRRKSLAYRLTYQADDRTLTDQEVAEVRDKIVRQLQKELGAALRG